MIPVVIELSRSTDRLHQVVLGMQEVQDILAAAVTTDGAHHKQWYLEAVAKRLGLQLPEHEAGVAP